VRVTAKIGSERWRNLRATICSWDIVLAVAVLLCALVLIPHRVSGSVAIEVYQLCVNVLAIVFSVYFAALAIVIASPDDDFVRFLEEKGDFTRIVWSLQFCLKLLFAALATSLILFVRMVVSGGREEAVGEFGWLLAAQCGLTAYALLATHLSARDCITFAHRRAAYTQQHRDS